MPTIQEYNDQIKRIDASLTDLRSQVSWLTDNNIDSSISVWLERQINDLRRQRSVLMWRRDAQVDNNVGLSLASDPRVLSNNFAFNSEDINASTNTSWIASNLSQRVENILSWLRWSGTDQINALQELRTAASWITQNQLDRSGQTFDWARQGILAQGSVNQWIAWWVASRAWASTWQRLATINNQQAATQWQLSEVNLSQLQNENEVLNNFLAQLATVIWNENAIRWNTATNVSNIQSWLADNIAWLEQNELSFQRSLPDLLLQRLANQQKLWLWWGSTWGSSWGWWSGWSGWRGGSTTPTPWVVDNVLDWVDIAGLVDWLWSTSTTTNTANATPNTLPWNTAPSVVDFWNNNLVSRDVNANTLDPTDDTVQREIARQNQQILRLQLAEEAEARRRAAEQKPFGIFNPRWFISNN